VASFAYRAWDWASGSLLVRSLLSTLSGGSASKLAMLITTLAAARGLEPMAFGLYSGFGATAMLSSFCWDLGVSPVVAREIASGRIGIDDALRQGAGLRVWTLPLWFAGFVSGAAILNRGAYIPLSVIGAFAAASLFYGASMLLCSILRGALRFALAELVVAMGRSATAVISISGLWYMRGFHGLRFFAAAVLLGDSLAFFAALFLVAAARSRPVAAVASGTARIDLRSAAPFAANSMMVLAYNRFDVVVVAALSSTQELALYAPASRFQDALQLIPGSVLAIGLPIMSRLWHQPNGSAAVRRTIRNLVVGAMLITLPISIASLALTPWLLVAVLGPAYIGATCATRILICSLLFNAISIPFISALAATGHASDTTKVVGLAFLVALGGHLMLDTRLGATGGAIASLLRDPAATLAAVFFARRAGLCGGVAPTHRVETASVVLSADPRESV